MTTRALLGRSSARSAAVGGVTDQRVPVRPYPQQLEEQLEHRGLRLTVRPIRREDLSQHRRFLARISPQDLYTRFFSGMRSVPEPEVVRCTQIDYRRDMAFVATARVGGCGEETLGVASACEDARNANEAEIAVLVRSDLKNQGLGRLLMDKLIGYCRARGVRRLRASVLSDNGAMLHLAGALGFVPGKIECNVEELSLDLQPRSAPA
jgi:acetyltransferase